MQGMVADLQFISLTSESYCSHKLHILQLQPSQMHSNSFNNDGERGFLLADVVSLDQDFRSDR